MLESDVSTGDFVNEAFLHMLSTLSQDSLVDVRIRVARLLGSFSGTSCF